MYILHILFDESSNIDFEKLNIIKFNDYCQKTVKYSKLLKKINKTCFD